MPAERVPMRCVREILRLLNYYYGLGISTPGYIGGYFWWHCYEDMLPHYPGYGMDDPASRLDGNGSVGDPRPTQRSSSA